ncbi:MAG: porin [Desulfuromusa sp.]|nr:porin [Desulfuromusa sp.]
MRRVSYNLLLGIMAIGLLFVNSAQPASAASIEEKLERLEQLLQQQQQQIESQSRTIEQLEDKLDTLAGSAPEPARAADQQVAQSDKPVVQSGNDKVNVKLYGQLNRGVLVVDDGDSTNTYQVDNANSSTRIGLLGSVKPIKDWSIGTRFEVEFQSNSSSAVSQEEKSGVGGNNFHERWVDIFINSRYGKLSLGQGDTASNNTSELDLSGTTVAGYSDPNGVAGGQFFYDNSTKDLSSTKAKDVFNNLDGLSRDDRIRYDTPEWHGLKLATSAISGDGGDVALFYTYKNDSFNLVAGAAYSNPGSTSDTTDDTVNGSVSLLHVSGLNLTLAGGVRELRASERDDPTFFYTKLGYKQSFFEIGETALSLDYGTNDDVEIDGDEATAFGAQLVQYLEPWAAEFYLSYRNYDLDRSGSDFESINALLSGLRVKF